MNKVDFMQLLILNKRRSKLEIYVDVLRAIYRGINRPTKIMFAANLSWKTLKEVLDYLERQGIIERRTAEKRKLFFITEKGRRILDAFETLATEFEEQDLALMYRPTKKLEVKRAYELYVERKEDL